MEDEIRYPFEQIESILYKHAYRLHKKFPNKYEVDELVNEVWVKGNIQKLNNIKYVSARAYFDMLDYIRTNEGRHIMEKGVFKKCPKVVTNMHRTNESHDYEGDFFEDYGDYRKTSIDDVDDKEELDYIFSFLSKRSVNILRMHYLEEKTLKEVGQKLNIEPPTVSNQKKKAFQTMMKIDYIKITLALTGKQGQDIIFDSRNRSRRIKVSDEKFIEAIMEDILPEYVVDYEIDNECAADGKFKAFVLETDWSQDADL